MTTQFGTPYTPADLYHETLPVANDGFPLQASTLNVPAQSLADSAEYLRNHKASLDDVADFTGIVRFHGSTEIDTTVDVASGGITFESTTSLLVKTGATCTVNGGLTCNIGSVTQIHGSLTCDGNTTFTGNVAIVGRTGGGSKSGKLDLSSACSVMRPSPLPMSLSGTPETITRATSDLWTIGQTSVDKQIVLDTTISAGYAPTSGDRLQVRFLTTTSTHLHEFFSGSTSNPRLCRVNFSLWTQPVFTFIEFYFDGTDWHFVGGAGCIQPS